ncbi:MAG: hypothetical protein ACJ8J0_02640, partial [Longimicrobiaceae bacterium]
MAIAALTEAGGDMERAIDLLRAKGAVGSMPGLRRAALGAGRAKVRRRKMFVRGAGLRRSETVGWQAPRSFREGVERSLVERATSVIRMSLERMTVEQIQKAIAAPTPAATVVEVLNAAPEVGLARETATTRALARGAAAKQEMIQAAGGCLSSGEVAKLLGKTVSAVNQRRARGQILAVPLSGGEWGFPASQFSAGDLRGGIAEVVQAARTMNPWVLLSILLDRIPGSGSSIIDSLDRPGVMEDVL